MPPAELILSAVVLLGAVAFAVSRRSGKPFLPASTPAPGEHGLRLLEAIEAAGKAGAAKLLEEKLAEAHAKTVTASVAAAFAPPASASAPESPKT